jgi:hypothetical protein
MKLTKKMETLIDRRTTLAMELMKVCSEVDNLIRDNGLENEVEDYDWLTGCEVYCNPAGSGKRIKDAIRNHKEANDGNSA